MVLSTLPVLVILGRLWSLQVDSDTQLLWKIRAEHAKLVRVAPRRGLILDRNGHVLAENRAVFDLHFKYSDLNPRYIVIEVLCEELAKLDAFPSPRDVERHLRGLASDAVANVEGRADAELLLVEDIPASAAREIQRRLRLREIFLLGFSLRRSRVSSSADAAEEFEEQEDDAARYALWFRPAETMRLERTFARLDTLLGPSETVDTLLASLEEEIERIATWARNYVRADREAGVDEEICLNGERNARRAYFEDSWPLAKDVGIDVVTQIEYHPELFPGVEVVDGYRRHYPLGEAAGTLIGFLGDLKKKQIVELEAEDKILDLWTRVRSAEAFSVLRQGALRRSDRVGVYGLENFYDERLRGLYGMRVVQIDSRMRERSVLATLAAQDGVSLRTTIDAELQVLLYEELSAHTKRINAVAGSVVVMSVPDGEVIVSVGFPSIDPNRMSNRAYLADVEARWKGMTPGGWVHRPFYQALDPGSIAKVITAAAALEDGDDWEGEVDPLREYECVPNSQKLFPIPCGRKYGHGVINLRNAFSVSCNNYFYYLGVKHLDATRFDTWSRRFGFGESPGLDLPRRSGHYDAGFLRAPEKIHGESGLCMYAIGQSHVQTTPMQIARMMGAVATNCDTLPTPWLVDRSAPRPMELSSPRTGKIIAESLRLVVSQYGGTLYKHGLERYHFAGKTGTAQFRDHGKRYHAWLAGFGPVPRPSYAFVVVLEDTPKMGGTACGPIAKILLEWLAKKDPRFLDPTAGHRQEGER
jgi:penicillin-binding protein 2